MSFWRKLKYLLPSYRRAQERDMREELESLAAIGEPDESRRELGNLTRAAEEARAVWSWTWLEQAFRDVQYALRTMRHSPGFTATAVLSLALGIGANTAIFSLIDALMLRWLPVRDPQELVQLKYQWERANHPMEGFSYAIVTALADQKDIFSTVGGFSGGSFSVGPPGSLSRIPGAWVTGDFYETLGVNPVAGRLLTRADDQPGAPLVAVISYGYWERQFARSSQAIGQLVPMNGVPVRIAAIGAGRGRIIRQLLTESVLLSSLGAALGIGLAWLASRFLVGILSTGPAPVVFDLSPNWHVLAFTSAVAMATGVLFGLAPAFQSTSAPAVKGDARMTGSRSRLLSSLVSTQVALSLMLLVGAGLFVRTLQNLLNVDLGFRQEGVLLMDIDGRREGYHDARLAAFYRELLDQVQRIPGVRSVSISGNTPLSGNTWTEAVAPKGQTLPENDNCRFIAVGPGYFETMQTPLTAGREFNGRSDGNPQGAIVNEAFVKRYFPGENPVGRYLSATVTRPPSDLEIIGVVKDTVTDRLRAVPPPVVYVSYFQPTSAPKSSAGDKWDPNTTTLEIRAEGSLSRVAAALQKELQPRFPSTPVEVRALTDQVERTLVQERLMANLAGGFGVLGLVLACVGLYGLLAYSVVRRTKEIGIRMALGAEQSRVRWMVGKGALRLVVLGVALGLPAAWVASRWVNSMLFGLTASDPAIMAIAALLLVAAGLAAAYLPARRAARVDPMTALRHE